MASVANLQNAILRINGEFKRLPYFISTGKKEVLKNPIFKSIYPLVYEKGIDDEKLCDDIIQTINEQPNRIIKNKYPEIFSWLEGTIADEVLSIIKIYENREFANADTFNKVRKVLDWIMSYLYDYGLLAIKFNGANLNECSKFLGKSKLQDVVPVHIQRHLYSLVTIANEGSHRQHIDEEVKTNKAPFLVASTIFELLNVLTWLHQLPNDTEEKQTIEKLAGNLAFDLIHSNNKS